MTPRLAPAPGRTGTREGTDEGRGSPAGSGSAPISWRWVAALAALSSAFAVATAVVTTNPPERWWGTLAACGYAVAALTAVALRGRGTGVAVLISLAGGLLAPLGWMAATGRAQPEVAVIIRSAVLLVHHGTPYLGTAALAAAHTPYAYDPYLPVLTLFGLPRALGGGGLLTDPRIAFAAVFVIAFWGALVASGITRPMWWTAVVTASPIVAFPLSVGGDDLPVLGLECLALALLGARAPWKRPQPAASGFALGLAAAMKATAWPALAVALVLAAAVRGKRAATWFSLSAFGVAGVAIASVAVTHPAAMVANTILFPLGLAGVKSPAASMLPGHLIASAWPWGNWAALAILASAGVAVGAWLVIWPPRDERAAGWRLVLGLTLMFTLAPATRLGYFVYPLGLAVWLVLADRRILAARAEHTLARLRRDVCDHAPAAVPGLPIRDRPEPLSTRGPYRGPRRPLPPRPARRGGGDIRQACRE